MISKRMIREAMFNILPHLCVMIDVLADVSAGLIITILVDVLNIKSRANVMVETLGDMLMGRIDIGLRFC